jgi:hypothetical protein
MEYNFDPLPLIPSNANIGREDENFRVRGIIYRNAAIFIDRALLQSFRDYTIVNSVFSIFV